jgi:hypothetical protein
MDEFVYGVAGPFYEDARFRRAVKDAEMKNVEARMCKCSRTTNIFCSFYAQSGPTSNQRGVPFNVHANT